jgi:uncharacterized low-complexity protein
MSKESEMKPIAAAISAALATTLVAIPTANADENPIGVTDLAAGYEIAYGDEGSCGEGKCGEADGEGEGEGKCGEADGEGEGKCGEADGEGEGSCGEGKCGEGKCGE